MRVDEYKSLPELFFINAEKHPDKALISTKVGGVYQDISWQSVKDDVYLIAAYLITRGITKGSKVAVFADNRPEWWVYDMAVLSLGGITVPLHAVSSRESIEIIMKKSACEICFVDTVEHLDILISMKKQIPLLKEFVLFDQPAGFKRNIKSYQELLSKKIKPADIKKIEISVAKIKPQQTATLIFTSGTTGIPKGVELSHFNFLSNAAQIDTELGYYFDTSDSFLSFLPLSHVLERTAGYYFPMTTSKMVYMAQDISTLQEDLVDARPTILVSVPRIYEKMHAGIVSKVEKASLIKKAIFKFSVAMGYKAIPYKCKMQELPFYLKKPHAIAEKLVLSKLRTAIGMDRLKFAISGGGPIVGSDMNFFLGMGVTVLEGFGLTETSPVTNLVLPDNIKVGSVGKPVENTEIRISEEGELLIKGPQLMKGYYRNRKATSEVIDADGFFHTGDIGLIDDEGFLYITGRIKDIIVTAGGKNISPQPIEQKLLSSRLIEQVAIVGDGRKFLGALIIPDLTELQKRLDAKGISLEGELKGQLNNPAVETIYKDEIDMLTTSFSRVELIRRFTILHEEWTIDGGELTASLKIKRPVIQEKYKTIIDAMYTEDI